MIDYKQSGVDIQAGDQLVSWLENQQTSAPQIQHTQHTQNQIGPLQNRIVSGIGGFAALFNGRFDQMKEPLLVSCTDGVGTKVKLASYFEDYSTVGQDLVAMCANDLICTGGIPLFFLDYYATGKLKMQDAQSFLAGVRKACDESHMALIGGETAEMPGVYQEKDFDCAGFSVGVVDKADVLGPHHVQQGDQIWALPSSGFHSNGYSLIRKVFEGQYNEYRKWLMEPTRLYVGSALKIRKTSGLKALAHITGGGVENIPRVINPNQKVVLKKWALPDCFDYVLKKSGMTDLELRGTLNCGIGLALIINEEARQSLAPVFGNEWIHLGHVENKNQSEEPIAWSNP